MCFSADREMISIEDQYFSFNRILLLAIGLWPYQKSTLLARFQSICFFSIEGIFIVSQLIILVTSKFTIDIVIKILSPTFVCIVCTLIYHSFYINGETVIYLMEQLQRVYDDINDKNEFMIIEKYAKRGKCMTIMLITLFFFFVSVYTTAQIWLGFFDVILSIDKAEPHYAQTDYIVKVKQKQYSHLRQLNMIVAFYMGTVATISTGTMFIAYIQHVCALFKIASYRIENALQMHILKDNTLKEERLTHKYIICAIDIHRKAMKFTNYLMSNLQMSLMLLIIFGVITLSMNIFQVSQVASTVHDLATFWHPFLPLIAVFGCTGYMFFSNYIGQQITDHNNDVYATAYNSCWYTASLHIQKLILFLLQRGSKTFGLSVGGMFVASLECFATLVKVSVSYFTVMYSTQ